MGRSSRWNDATFASIHPARSVTRARAGSGQRDESGLRRDQSFGLLGELGEVRLERVVVVRLAEGLAARHPYGHSLGDSPVDRGGHGQFLGYLGATTLTT